MWEWDKGRGLLAVGLGTKLTECEFHHHLHHHHPHPPLSVPHGPWERRWTQEGEEGGAQRQNRIGGTRGASKSNIRRRKGRREEEGNREGDLSEGLTLDLWADLKGLNRSKHRTKMSVPQQDPLIWGTTIIPSGHKQVKIDYTVKMFWSVLRSAHLSEAALNDNILLPVYSRIILISCLVKQIYMN